MRTKKDDDHTALIGRERGGRPRLEDHDRRTGRIGVPVNKEEEKAIECKSAAVYMKKGAFLRHLGLGKRTQRPVPAINYRAYRQLGRLAVSFSHVLLLIDAGKSVGIDRQLATQILNEIHQMQDLLRKGDSK